MGSPEEPSLRTPGAGSPDPRTDPASEAAHAMPLQPRTDVHALAAAYALDAVDDAEREDFEAHLVGCEPCRHEIQGFASTTALLATTVERPPPPELRGRILAAAAATRQDAPVVSLASRRARGARFLSVAAALLLVVTGALSVVTVQSGRRAQRAEQVAAIVGAPDAHLVQLTVQGGGEATFVWSTREDEGVLIGEDLRAASDAQLALWLIHDEDPVLIAAFDAADGAGGAIVVDGRVAGADVVAITAEPPGAVGEAPQGPLVASAALT